MPENRKNLQLTSLRNEIHDSVRSFADKLIAELGDNLQSITVVGSSLTNDFKPGRSDTNTVLVLSKLTLESLKSVADMAKSMSKRKLSAPLLMTPTYIERSSDVFGIEFLDFQLTHKTIFGNDPFNSLNFDKRDVRLQCERELKATLIRLRQGYIAAAARKSLVRDILISATKGLAPLLRAMLWLKDLDREAEAESTIIKAAVEFSVNMDSLLRAGRWRHEKIQLRKDEIENAFEAVYTTVEQLTQIVDKLEI
jgi:hypothetical protein